MNIYKNNRKIKVKAAADVLRKLYEGGHFIVDPEEAAGKMLDAAYQPNLWFKGVMQDGAAVLIQFVDKGDLLMGYDENNNRFEAFTSWWRLSFIAPREPGGQYILEEYVETPRDVVEDAPDADAYRFLVDLAALEKMGVDINQPMKPDENGTYAEEARAILRRVYSHHFTRSPQPRES